MQNKISITYNLLDDLVHDHVGHIWLQLSKCGDLVDAKLLAQNRVSILANLENLLISHEVALCDERWRRNVIILGFINTPLEREVTYNWHVTDNSVVL